MGDVLPVNQHAARVQVMKAQQQVDQRGLARAGPANQADFFTRPHHQVQPVNHRFALAQRVVGVFAFAVAEGGVFKAHLAAWHHQHGGLGRVHNQPWARQRVDAVLHRAHAFKQTGGFPHHPVRHALQPQRHGGGRRHRARAHLALAPQPQRHARHAQNQPHAQRMVHHLKRRHQPHLGVAGVHELLHG